ncbi:MULTISPECIES: hypothetical protein [Cohnella]|uniref:hypothetical protein n=1 Tax=Cohnella TaxID=329857 RepID=UPI0009B9FA25|nr:MULTISPECIES: hypothetical protein [Cohnella]
MAQPATGKGAIPNRQEPGSGAPTHRGDAAPEGPTPGIQPPEPASLKGAFVSVMLLGAFLAAAWAAVFVLYLHRS